MVPPLQQETEKEPENVFGILRTENLRLQEVIRDQEAELWDLQNQCRAQEQRIEDFIDMRNYMQCELRADNEFKKMRDKWLETQRWVDDIKDELERDFLPRAILLSRNGRNFHTTAKCQGLVQADHSSLRTVDVCTFCAQASLMR